MALSGNKGEWSELYAVLVLLAEGRLKIAAHDLSLTGDVYQVVGVQRRFSTGDVAYEIDLENKRVIVTSGTEHTEIDLAELDPASRGPQIGYLPQDIELLEGSIAENIARFGEVDPEQVIAAARRAGIHDMVLRFPAGYDTPVGVFGNLLSGGQRQRLGLARALYGAPALVVLDEPDANLDDAGTAALVEALRELRSLGRTVFVISHRMNLLALADRIVLLVNGEIRLDGPRQQVLDALRKGGGAGPAPAAPVTLQPA